MEKLWIYTLSKKLTEEQEIDLKNRCQTFVSGWTAHDTSLDASFGLYKHRLLIFKVDETKYAASGCSIDKQLRLVKELEQVFAPSKASEAEILEAPFELLNRLLVAYEMNGVVEVVKASEIKELLTNITISKDTLVYDNTITNSDELNSSWKKPLSETYLAKYLVIV